MIDVDFIGTTEKRVNKTKRFTLSERYRRVILDPNDTQEIRVTFSRFNKSQLSTRSQDLLDAATGVFYADQSKSKSQFSQNRKLNMVLPVRDMKLWQRLSKPISNICTFLDQNPINVHFCKQDSIFPEHHEAKDPFKGDVVSLFSGGLDSLSGILRLLTQGRNPILVGVAHSDQTKGIQTNLYKLLKEDFPDLEFTSLNMNPNRKNIITDGHEYKGGIADTQSCRSFLYLTAGVVVAFETQIEEVNIAENGILALNTPLSPGRVNTRTVHPFYISEYGKFVASALGTSFRIDNPFWYLTKAQSMKILRNHPGYIPFTTSCWQSSRVPIWSKKIGRRGRHCGFCYPCIIRRIALVSLGLDKYDVDYAIDMFRDIGPNHSGLMEQRVRNLTINMSHLLQFVGYILNNSRDEISDLIVTKHLLPEWYDINQAVKMYKQFAKEVKNVCTAKGNAELGKMMDTLFSLV